MIARTTPTAASKPRPGNRGISYPEHLARLEATPSVELDRNPDWPEAAVSVRRHPDCGNPAAQWTTGRKEPCKRRQWVLVTWERPCGCRVVCEYSEPDCVIYFAAEMGGACRAHRTPQQTSDFQAHCRRMFGADFFGGLEPVREFVGGAK